MRSTKVEIPFVDYGSDVPVVKVRLKDKEVYCIIDTGSEITLFDKSLKDSLTIQEVQKMSLVGVSGNNAAMTSTVSTAVGIPMGKNKLFVANLSGYLNDLSIVNNHFAGALDTDVRISILFGSDMFNLFNCKIDFEKRIVTFHL